MRLMYRLLTILQRYTDFSPSSLYLLSVFSLSSLHLLSPSSLRLLSAFSCVSPYLSHEHGGEDLGGLEQHDDGEWDIPQRLILAEATQRVGDGTQRVFVEGDGVRREGCRLIPDNTWEDRERRIEEGGQRKEDR